MKYILSIDSGTTSVRALIFDQNRQVLATAQKEIKQYYPQNHWVEHDALEIYNTQYEQCLLAIAQAGLQPTDISAIGITNQRETIVAWDRHTGAPLHHAIVWQDKRTLTLCEKLIQQNHSELITSKTGLKIDSYFSALKIKWLLENIPEIQSALRDERLMIGTIDSWLLYKLTQGTVHATDISNASRTMLYNIHDMSWDDEILDLLSIPKHILPEVKENIADFGHAILEGHSIPILAMIGDQQSALFGQSCLQAGDIKNTYGTGCFLLMNTGTQAIHSKHGLLTTVAWSIAGVTHYALEGSVFNTGSTIQWLRDQLQLITSSQETEFLATQVEDNGGVYLIPAFSGLGAPYWNENCKAAILGLTHYSSRNHIVRAALESIAYQTYDVVQAMQQDSAIPITALKVDGGATQNRFLMQFQASIADLSIHVANNSESTALGTALLVFQALDMSIPKEIDATIFYPNFSAEHRNKLLTGWQKAITFVLQQ